MAASRLPALETLERQLVSFIRERLLDTPPDFDAESSLYEAGLDSMALMQLLILIEAEYAVVLPDSDLTHRNFSTARRVAELICARQAGGSE